MRVDRIDDGVDHGRWCANGAGLTGALYPRGLVVHRLLCMSKCTCGTTSARGKA